MRRLLSMLLLICTAAVVRAQDTSALINKALDERVNLKIDNTLPEAMATITKETGVRLQEDPVIWDLLPWGRETRIQATLENATLRDALRAITRKAGLTLVLRDNYVEIQPMPALRRLAKRASHDELRSLDYLASTPLNANPEKPVLPDRPTVKALLEAVDLKLAENKDLGIAIENRTRDVIKQDKTVFVPRNATLMDALESLTKDTKATWYPWGKYIEIVTKEDRTRGLLSKPLTILRPGERAIDVLDLLREISSRTGVSFEYQPGAIQSLRPEARSVRITIDNIPAQDILETIAATTGLGYTVQDDKVVITSAAAAPGATPARDPIIGMIQLDNGMQILVPTSQVPPDLREFLKYKTQKELAKIRKMMEEEGFKPTTQPSATTKPDSNEDL